uniref:Uncharacterized protein n=1 Tax=Rhizophora mucronata TaxID=61149 RepID=A0A2P2NRC0_RHIMU
MYTARKIFKDFPPIYVMCAATIQMHLVKHQLVLMEKIEAKDSGIYQIYSARLGNTI